MSNTLTDERFNYLVERGYSVRERTTPQTGYVVYFRGEPVPLTLAGSRNAAWQLADEDSNNRPEAQENQS